VKNNILLIQADQHRADCIGVNGGGPLGAVLQTPHLDQLARDGINFSHAFCPIPLCTPSRTSLLTGTWPQQHGNIINPGTEVNCTLQPGLPTFSETLRDTGYTLGYVGKWGVDTKRDPTVFGFTDYVPERAYTTWRSAQNLPPKPKTNRWFGEVDPHITPDQSALAWGANETIRLLHKAAASDQPFFIHWDPSEPHLPNVVPEPYASLYPPETIPPWPNFTDPLTHKPYIQAQQRRTWAIDDWTWENWAPIVGRYLGEITLLDQQIGRILATLDELGLAENTVVVYTADHGDMCGGHGMIDKHYVMYDELVRVPLIIRWPGVVAPGRNCNNFITHGLDLAATFCDLAGVDQPNSFAGESLLPVLLEKEQPDQSRSDIFASYYGNQFGLYSQRMVRDRRWKYVWNATAEDELYDLASDPGEITNLAAQSVYAPEVARLRLRLLHWMEQTQDPMLNSWIRQQLVEGNKR